MRVIPADVILSWPTPNYVDPTTRGPGLVIANGIMIALAVIIVALRMYTRMFLLRWLGIDDLFILIAAVFAIGMTACVILANMDYGWDRHIWDLHLDKFSGTMKIAMAARIVFCMAAGFTRLSLLVFYYRLVRESGMRLFKYFLHISTLLTVSLPLTYTFITIFQCAPIRAFWTYPPLPNQRCLDEGKVLLGAGIVNTFLDLLTTLTPIPLIVQLHLPWRRRLGAIFLVSLGLIVTVAGALRSYFTWQSLLASYDETWYCYGLWLASGIEIDLGVICACAPALRLLFARTFGSTSYASESRHTGTYKLSKLQAFPPCRGGHHTLHSTDLESSKNMVPVVSVKGSRKGGEQDNIWDKPWSGNGVPKSRRASADISGNMSPLRVGKASLDMVDQFGTSTTITAGDNPFDAHLINANSSVRGWPLSPSSNRVTAAVANMTRHTSIKVKVERKQSAGSLEDADTRYEENSVQNQSEDDIPLPIQWDEEKGMQREGSAPVRLSSEGRPSEPSNSAEAQRSQRGKTNVERWREKQQKQQAYGWSLGT